MQRGTPKVISSREVNPGDQNLQLRLLLEPSDLFSYETAVSCYFLNDDNFELLFAVGKVESIRQDKMIQVVVKSSNTGQDEFFQRMKNSDASSLKKVFVKPYLPYSLIQRLFEGREE